MKFKTAILHILLILTVALYGCSEKKQEGPGELVIYSPNVDEIMNNVIPMFEKETGIKVIVVSAGSGEISKRIAAEKDKPYADVNFGGYVNNPEYYEEYRSPNLDSLPEEMRNTPAYATPYMYSGSCLLVNENLIGDIKITSYKDLLNPALKGKIASGDPANSSSAFAQLTNMLTAFGGYDSPEAWEFVDALAANINGKIFSSSGAVHRSVVDGEFIVALTYEDPSASYVKSGAPVRVVYPEEGTVFIPSIVAIVKNAKNMENAKKFADFMLTPAVQDFFGTQLTSRPLSPYAKLGSYLTPYSEIVVIHEDEEVRNREKNNILENWAKIIAKYQK